MTTEYRATLSASSINGSEVHNRDNDNIGNIKDLMIDVSSGEVRYAVLDFGGILGVGNKLFAVPFGAFQVDQENEVWILDVDKETLKNAEGFDEGDWPDFSDRAFESRVHEHYDVRPYWQA